MRTPDPLFSQGMPASPQTEQLILGAALIDPDSIPIITSSLSADDFSIEKHRTIFRTIESLFAAGRPVDRVTVANALIEERKLESVDGVAYLTSLDDGLPQIFNLESYCSTIVEKSTIRKAMICARSLCERLVLPGATRSDIESIASKLNAIAAVAEVGSGLESFEEFLSRPDMGFANFFGKKNATSSTPWGKLNAMLTGGGFQAGQLVIVGARPGMGKSAFAAELGFHAAANDVGTGVFSLEMAASEYWRRVIANASGVSLGRLHHPPNAAQLDGVNTLEAMNKIAQLPIWVDDGTGVTVSALISKVRKLTARKRKPGLVIVDYLGLISGRSRQNRAEEVSEISRALKLAAKEMGNTFIVLAQLNRESEKEDREPRLSDLRESGSIEQDADIVVFLHQKASERVASIREKRPARLKLIMAKQRNGPIGAIDIEFDAPRMTMRETEKEQA